MIPRSACLGAEERAIGGRARDLTRAVTKARSRRPWRRRARARRAASTRSGRNVRRTASVAAAATSFGTIASLRWLDSVPSLRRPTRRATCPATRAPPAPTSNDASSSYRSRAPGVASVRTRRSGSLHRRAQPRGLARPDLRWRDRPCRRRQAAHGPGPRMSRRRGSRRDVARGSAAARLRRSEQRPRGAPAHLVVFRLRPLHDGCEVAWAVEIGREASSASPTTGWRCGDGASARYFARTVPRLGRSDLAERARGFARDGRGRRRPREPLTEPGHGVGVFQLSGGKNYRARDLDVRVATRGDEQCAGLGRHGVLGVRRALSRKPDATDRERGTAPHLGVRGFQQRGERLLIEGARVLEHDELRDGVDVRRGERRPGPGLREQRGRREDDQSQQQNGAFHGLDDIAGFPP